MPKYTVEIDDNLEDWCNEACDLVRDELDNYLTANPDTVSCPDMADLDYSGSTHEIIDGCCPIYTKEIENAWYLHKADLVQAYEQQGLGDNPMDNGGTMAIYCYIQDEVSSWWHSYAEEIFEEWYEQKMVDEAEDEEEDDDDADVDADSADSSRTAS